MVRFVISVPIGSWHPFLPAVIASLRAQGPQVSVAFLDASNDPRVKAVADANDDWLAYRRHGPDKGQSDAILEGWANVEGDWLGWLNADDLLMPGTLAKVQQALDEDPDLEIVYGQSTILDDDGAMIGYHFNVSPPGPKLLEGCIISQPSCLFKREKYDAVGGLNRDLHYVMDWDLWIRLYKADAKFAFLDAPMSQVLWGADTKSASLNRRRRDELRAIIAKHTPEEKQKEIFRAFAIHAYADMLWPPALKASVIRHLRHHGPQMYGFRANGQTEGRGILYLAHYDEQPKRGVRVVLKGPVKTVSLETPNGVSDILYGARHIELYFDQALPAQTQCQIDLLKVDTDNPVIFLRAEWIT